MHLAPRDYWGTVSFPSDCKEVCSRLGLLGVDLFRLSLDWYSETDSFRPQEVSKLGMVDQLLSPTWYGTECKETGTVQGRISAAPK